MEKMPTKKNFTLSSTELILGEEESSMLEITWAPEQEGGVRELVVLRVNDSIRLQFVLLGHAFAVTPSKKVAIFCILICFCV